MSNSLQTIFKLLPQLKPAELQAVKAKVDLLSSLQEPKPDTNDWLAEGIMAELIRRGLQRKLPAGYWRKWAPKGFSIDSAAVRVQLQESFPNPLTQSEAYALGKAVARALADYLQGVPGFGLKVMLQNINKVPEALDSSFPGYLAAGMLGRLIKGKS